MSYDVTIGDEWFNYTSNLGALFYDHAPDGLRGLDGLRGKDGAGFIAAMLNNIHSSHLREGSNLSATYDPPNQWGCVIGALLFLARLMAACHENPRSKIHVNC
jgi:hypothetical protein